MMFLIIWTLFQTGGAVLPLSIYTAWRVVPLLAAEPTITVDYLAEANRLSRPIDYDPDLNAAPRYERLFADFVPLPPGLEDQWKAWPADLSVKQRKKMEAWLPRNEAALVSLSRGAQCPYCWRHLTSSDGSLSGIVVPDLEAVRHCAWGVILRAKQQASEGHAEDALISLTNLYHLGMHWTQGTTLLEQLVGLVLCNLSDDGILAVLDHCEVPADALSDALDSLRSRVGEVHVPCFGETGRIYGYDLIQRSFTDDGEGRGRLIPERLYLTKKNRVSLYSSPISFLEALWIGLNHPDRRETTALFTTYFRFVAALARRTPWQLHAAATSYGEQLQELLEGNYFLDDAFMSMAQCIRLGWRGKATGRALVAILGVFAYKAEEGSWPQSFDQLLDKGLLEEVPKDPYSDGPLVYKVADDDFTLYSVGEDFTDNGGEPGDWDDFGTDRVFWPVTEGD